MPTTSKHTLLTTGLLTALLLILPAGIQPKAGNPAGLGLRLVESTDSADPFSPRNEDGRFDVNTLRATFAVGPLGPPQSIAAGPGDRPGPMRRNLEHHSMALRVHYEVASSAGMPVFVADLDLPVGAPLDIVHLPVDGGRVAPFAQVSIEIPWDGRDLAGDWVPDGTYPTRVSGALHLDAPGQADKGGTIARADGSITVDNSPPDVDEFFPPAVSLTDSEQVIARGRAVDPSGVASLAVNGVPVQDLADLPEWRVTVDLLRGDNGLRLTAEDAVGNRGDRPFANTRREGTLLYLTNSVAYDPLRDSAVVGDIWIVAVIAIDLDSGERRILSGAGVGSGPDLPRPDHVEYDRARDRVLVIGPSPDSVQLLVAVDPDSGDRTIVSHPSTNSGPDIDWAEDTEIDEANDRLLVCDNQGNALIGIDLETGERSLLSGAGVRRPGAAGPAHHYGRSVAGDRLCDPGLLIAPTARHRPRYGGPDAAHGRSATEPGLHLASGRDGVRSGQRSAADSLCIRPDHLVRSDQRRS